MDYIERGAFRLIERHLRRGKSLLLLGPRQTGKTTLLSRLDASLAVSLVSPDTRIRYERRPELLRGEVEALPSRGRKPLVVLDEIQKVPKLLDLAQEMIDGGVAQIVLCGSSARKLRRGASVNLLPGRVVNIRMDPLSLEEAEPRSLEDALLDGALPGVASVADAADRESDLASYVGSYLEEEVRSEALVRDLGAFSRFLEHAGTESGRAVSFRRISQDLGVAHTTVSGYYEILVDCLIAEAVEPYFVSASRRRLVRSRRYLIFDLGVRRLCANEGRRLTPERWGELFEHFVGLELIRSLRVRGGGGRLRCWRDPAGPEVDWLVELPDTLTPVKVKWTTTPGPRDVRHLEKFLDEYAEAERGYVVCRSERRSKISRRVTAIPWQDLPWLVDQITSG